MAHGLYYKVKAYLGRDFTMEEVKLVQEVNTSNHSIAEWNISGEKAQPTVEQLNALEAEATKLENNNLVRTTRKSSYGDIGDQLDLLYKDMVAGKLDTTGEWAKKIKAVKDANAKE
jgi:hypothetical protein